MNCDSYVIRYECVIVVNSAVLLHVPKLSFLVWNLYRHRHCDRPQALFIKQLHKSV